LQYKKNRKGLLQKLGIAHHEFWPWWLLVMPIWPLWVWYMLRSGKLTWFTAVNPGMEDSGFLGESKMRILNSIPSAYKPETFFIEYLQPLDLQKVQLAYPFIAKPDIGGRGRKIRTIHSVEELQQYHQEVGEDYMIQQMIPFQLELGIFYIRMPYDTKGEIVSVAQKEFLQVTGDGRSCIRDLMNQDHRASLQISRLEAGIDLNEILAEGEIRLLEPIGNHCRGTIFRDRGDLICEELCNVFDELCKQIDGFYYGRFDLRVKSIDDLMKGKHIQIMELNGLTADAAHIFDPNARLRDALLVQISNCRKSFKIARYNLRHGATTTPVKELYRKSRKGF
jgi:hypothetical protein